MFAQELGCVYITTLACCFGLWRVSVVDQYLILYFVKTFSDVFYKQLTLLPSLQLLKYSTYIRTEKSIFSSNELRELGLESVY